MNPFITRLDFEANRYAPDCGSLAASSMFQDIEVLLHTLVSECLALYSTNISFRQGMHKEFVALRYASMTYVMQSNRQPA